MSDNSVWWNGERLGDEVLGLSLAGSDLPGHVLAAGHDRTDLVRPDQLHRFLACHASQRFACYDVAPLHWTIHQQLVNDPVGQELLWDISRASRFLDVDLLDQRYRPASDGVNPQCRSLEKLADAYGISEPPESGSTLPVPVRQGRQPKTILRLYQELDRRIKAFLQRTRIPLDLACCFGPLGHGLDVQGAIAVGSPGTTLVVSTEGGAQLQRAIQQKYRLSSDLLARDRRVSRCFHWEGKQIARDEIGNVRWKEGKLREWLQYRAEGMYDINDRPLGRPLDDQGRVSLDPDRWGVLACGHPQLRAWSELVRAARLERTRSGG